MKKTLPEFLLAFNEPDVVTQSNLTPLCVQEGTVMLHTPLTAPFAVSKQPKRISRN